MGAESEMLSERRVRLGLWVAASFVAVLASIAANDALVQAGGGQGSLRLVALACLLASSLALVGSLARFLLLLRRSMTDANLRRHLWDELATSNHVRSMVIAYFAMVFVACPLAVVSMFTTLSAPWIVNGMLVTAFASQAISFALLERRGAR